MLDKWHFITSLGKNSYKRDEMPKNSASRYIMTHCSADVSWVEDMPTDYSAHKRRKGAHSMVSGLVRASVKRETRQDIESQINENLNSRNSTIS